MGGKSATRKGNRYNHEVVQFLKGCGWDGAERLVAGESADRGDVTGVDGWVIECKNHKTLRFGEWCDELPAKIKAAGARHGVVIAKRARRETYESYAVMPLHSFIYLIQKEQSWNRTI